LAGFGTHTGDDEMRTTPDGTPYLAPAGYPGEDDQEDDNSEERSTGTLLAVLFLLLFAVVMIVMASGSAIGGETCLLIVGMLAVLAVVVVRIVVYEPPQPSSMQPAPEPVREVRIETIHETVKVRCRYCGTLNLVTDTKCESCGANL